MPDRLILYLFNLYFYTLFLLASFFVIPALTFFVALTRLFSSHRRTMKRFRRAISWYGMIVMALPFPFTRIRYEKGDGNNPDGPYIFICNHRSASDAFFLGVLPHEVVQIVNVWPFRIPVLGQYARFSGYLNIRMISPEEFSEKAVQLLNEGVSIAFFPEGTRSVTGKMGPFHGAAFRLALDSRAPLVPLCISGSEKIMPKGSLLLRPGTVVLRRLPAIIWAEYKDLTPFAFKNRVWDIIDRELAAMESSG